MAKGQKRTNREVKKPKAAKPSAATSASGQASKAVLTSINPPKKKD